MKCPKCCDVDMEEKGDIDLHDTECSCCSSKYRIWQCPRCKNIEIT